MLSRLTGRRAPMGPARTSLTRRRAKQAAGWDDQDELADPVGDHADKRGEWLAFRQPTLVTAPHSQAIDR
ncbi:MAG: hypothetical protein QOC69_3119 [Mycobacterium sp.]|jgi:hypothetical protein|nr:hypothetical protein [Mycobacterium sp.]